MIPPNLEYEFSYLGRPLIPVLARRGNFEVGFSALVDTGADISILDDTIGLQLGLDLAALPSAQISGVGGAIQTARLAEITVQLLFEPALEATLPVAFAPGIAAMLDNLLGRDLLEFFDLGLSHADRVIFLGRSESSLT